MGENEISKISEGLKKIGIGGITAFKAKGRGKKSPESVHASLGTEIYTPEFSDKYIVLLVLPDIYQVSYLSINNRIVGIYINKKKNKLMTKAALVIQHFKIITPEFAN